MKIFNLTKILHKEVIKDFVISISLSNLFFLQSWIHLLQPSQRFFMDAPPQKTHFIGLIIDVILLAYIFWTGQFLIKKSKNKIALKMLKVIFNISILIPLNAVRKNTQFLSTITWLPIFGEKKLLIITALLALCLLILLIFYLTNVTTFIKKTLIIFFPFFLFTFSKSILYLIKQQPIDFYTSAPQTKPNINPSNHNRILWIIFDEMDERLTFLDRPASLNLPNIDSLLKESIIATNAYPPNSETILSMPSLLSGKIVSKSIPLGANELSITYSGQKTATPWSKESNVFSIALKEGFNTALIGSFPPYCRIIGSSLTKCIYKFNNTLDLPQYTSTSLFNVMHNPLKDIISIIPKGILIHFKKFSDAEIKKSINLYNSIKDESLKLIIDPEINLILIHWPIPHAPFIFNRFTQKFIKSSLNNLDGYLDNLSLVDNTIGLIKQTLETEGLWDKTNVLISSDHYWRVSKKFDGKEDYRVPFILKLANQKSRVNFNDPFNTIITHDLLLYILKQTKITPIQVEHWINNNKTIIKSPYYYTRIVPF